LNLLQKIKYINLSTRISILLGAIILLAMGVFSAASLMKQEDDSIDSISRNTLLLSQTTERILRLSMLKNRRDEIATAINNIIGEEGIQSVRILDHKGIIRLSTKPSEIDQHVSRTNQLCTNCHNKGDNEKKYPVNGFYHYEFDKRKQVIYSSLPIYNSPSCYNGDCHGTMEQAQPSSISARKATQEMHPVHDSSQTILGFIEIEVSAKRITSTLDRSRTQLISLTLLITILASTITYFSIRRFVGKPVNKLVEGTRRVAEGDFKHEIPSGEAELGVLAESFNQMQRELLTKQSQLIESEKLASVGKLADEIANEISNPLTGVIIYTESLIEQSHQSAEEKADYETILRQALKIRESLKNILSLTRRGSPRFLMVDIDVIIKRTVAVLEKLSNFRNIRITVETEKNLPSVTGDPDLLEQVLLNLFLISSENMTAGGVLNISASHAAEEKKVKVRFANTGLSENILQAFTDHGTRLENKDRTEISLAVCRDIIAQHGGRIYAEPGTGSSLTIELPA